MLDRKRMVAEVAAKLQIRLDEDDPAFVLVELNKFALEEGAASLVSQIAPLGDRFEASAKLAAEQIIGASLQQIAGAGQAERERIAAAAESARSQSLAALTKFLKGYETRNRARWAALGLVVALALAGASFTAGYAVGSSGLEGRQLPDTAPRTGR